MKKAISIVVAVAIILVTGMVAGCVPQEGKEPPDEVTVQLKWIHQAQFAGCMPPTRRASTLRRTLRLPSRLVAPTYPPTKRSLTLSPARLLLPYRVATK